MTRGIMPLSIERVERRDDGLWPDPDGKIIQHLGTNRGTMRLLTRVEQSPPSSESEPTYPTNDDGDPLCTGKDDGQCGNTVDELGGTCWHHGD